MAFLISGAYQERESLDHLLFIARRTDAADFSWHQQYYRYDLYCFYFSGCGLVGVQAVSRLLELDH